MQQFKFGSILIIGFLLTSLTSGCAESASPVKPGNSSQYVLVPAVEKEISAHVSERVDVAVTVFDKSSGKAVSGARVRFRTQQNARATASLEARQVSTNDNGRAEVGLRLGSRSGEIKVQANMAGAKPQIFTISMIGYGEGTLNINPENTAPNVTQFEKITIRLYSSDGKSCSFFKPYQQQPQAIAKKTTTRIDRDVTFENLGAETEYLVTATGTGDYEQVAGGGCVDRISLDKGEELTKPVHLHLIQLDPTGRYKVTSQWDFSEALKDEGAIGRTIIRVFNIFENPGEGIYKEIIRLIRNYVNGLLAEGIDKFMRITGLDDEFEKLIVDLVEQIGVLSQIRDAGQKLRDIVTDLELQSILTVGKLSSSRSFRGTTNWLRVRLYLPWSCNGNEDECVVNLGANENGEIAQLGLLNSSWSGRVVSYNRLEINRHPLNIRYGRLIMYVLKDVVLPKLTNGASNTLSGAFSHWICPSLADSFAGSNDEICAAGQCISQNRIKKTCSDASSTVFGLANSLVEGMQYDLELTVGGNGKLVQTDSDRKVEKIVDGRFHGKLRNIAGHQSSVSADWTAERLEPGESF